MSFQSPQVLSERPSDGPLPLNSWRSLAAETPQAHPDPRAPGHSRWSFILSASCAERPGGQHTAPVPSPRGFALRPGPAGTLTAVSLPALPLGGRGLGREQQPRRTDPESPELPESPALRPSSPAPPRSSRPSRRPRRPRSPAVPATAAGRRPGVACRSPWRGIPAPPPSSSGSAVAGPVARREPGGGRLRRGRRGGEASRAAGGRVPGDEQKGRSVLPPGPPGDCRRSC